MDDCLFCKFVNKELTPAIIYEDENTLAFLDIKPAGRLDGHTLIIPKKHYATIEDIPEAELTNLILITKKIAIAIKKYSGATGINIISNNYPSAGQMVDHIHFHIVPRIENDGIYYDSKRRDALQSGLLKVASEIKEEISKTE